MGGLYLFYIWIGDEFEHDSAQEFGENIARFGVSIADNGRGRILALNQASRHGGLNLDKTGQESLREEEHENLRKECVMLETKEPLSYLETTLRKSRQ